MLLVVFGILDAKISKRNLLIMLVPCIVLSVIVAYRYDYSSDSSSDLYRYVIDFINIKKQGINYKLQYADGFSIIWKFIALVASNFNSFHWFSAMGIMIIYGIYIYILMDSYDLDMYSIRDIVTCILFFLVFIPFIMEVAASRNVLAYAFFSLGVYIIDAKNGTKKKIIGYVLLIISTLIHTTVIIGVVLYFVALLFKRKKFFSFFIPLWGIVVDVILQLVEKLNNNYLNYYCYKWNYYMEYPNSFDRTKVGIIIIAYIAFVITILLWWIVKYKENRNLSGYFIINMMFSLGAAGIMPSLFLRLLYPLAFLFPPMLVEIKKNVSIFRDVLFIVSIMAFIITGGGWLYQIKWF
ncbi:MAG: EpsG family protein [Butyrivibrio sp.]